jgi:hypothetical protein
MNDFTGPLPTAPKEGDRVFLATTNEVTWVKELAGHAMNGCFRITDKGGATRLVKRFKAKDLAGSPAWVTLG